MRRRSKITVLVMLALLIAGKSSAMLEKFIKKNVGNIIGFGMGFTAGYYFLKSLDRPSKNRNLNLVDAQAIGITIPEETVRRVLGLAPEDTLPDNILDALLRKMLEKKNQGTISLLQKNLQFSQELEEQIKNNFECSQKLEKQVEKNDNLMRVLELTKRESVEIPSGAIASWIAKYLQEHKET